MLLDLISDLHLDHDKAADAAFVSNYRPNPGATVLVVAGDVYSIAQPKQLADLLRTMAEHYQDVVFVPGNHEFWRSVPDVLMVQVLAELDEDPRIHTFFTPHSKLVQGQRFIGGTMFYREPGPNKVQDFVDFRLTDAPRSWFFEQQRLLEDQLYLDPDSDLQDVVVVTHHLPTPSSTPPQFRGSPTDHFFMCDMSGDIYKRNPGLWLHGHTHEPCDYVVGNDKKTRVVCNPRGYPFEYRARPPYAPKAIEFGVVEDDEEEE